jgi:hypothetical protein
MREPGIRLKMTVVMVLTMVLALFTTGANAAEDKKRVAVLYFDDHSRFDSPTGCGCLPSWPFKWIFGGSPKGREVWDLKWGFRKMLNEKLAESGVYRPVTHEEIEAACAKLRIKLKDLGKKEELRRRLAEELDLDAMIIGDVLKFGQERLRGIINARGLTRSMLTRMGVRAYFYVATVAIEIRLYDRSGQELSSFKIGKKAAHQIGSIGAGPLRTIISDMGLETRFGRQPLTSKISKKPPIVEKEKLDKIKFASSEYHKTLFGIATDSALEETVNRIREEIGPRPPRKEQAPEVIEGKVVHVSSDGTIFVNVGSEKGVTVGMRFKVFSTIPLVDPDTDEVLGQTTEKVGVIEIIKVESGKLSRAKAVEGGKFNRGDLIKHILRQDTP